MPALFPSLSLIAPPPVTPGHVWSAWTFEPGVVAGIVVSALWYALGVRAIWRRAGTGRGVSRWRAVCFALGELSLVIALLSPIDALAETLFSVHMVQHLLLMLAAAPLLVAGEPLLPALWALPANARRALGRRWRASPGVRRIVWVATDPLGVWLVSLAVLWFWHLPRAYDAAVANDGVHAIEHLSFLVTAYFFWWVVLQPLGRRRLQPAGAIVYLALTLMQSGALGVILAFSRTSWYTVHAAGAAAWHITPLTDQQLAGLIMSVPASFVYIGAALALAARWFLADPVPRRRPRAAAG